MLESIIIQLIAEKKVILSLILLTMVGFSFSQTPDWQWGIQANESEYSSNEGYSIATDEAGNSYVTGLFSGTSYFDAISLTSNGMHDIFVAKIDAAGSWIWAIQAGGSAFDGANSIALDGAGNLYLTGYFEETATFGSISLSSSGEKDLFVAKLDTNGNWQWAIQAGGSNYDRGNSIIVDEAGNSFVTGYICGTASFGTTSLTCSGESDIIAAKLDTSGNWQWAVQAGSSGLDFGNSIALDAVGNSYLTGFFSNTSTFGSTSLVSSGHFDIFVANLDNNGNWQWATKAGGLYTDKGESIAVNATGEAFVTGFFSDNAFFGSTTLISTNDFDIYVAKLGVDGNWQWAVQAGGADHDIGHSITLDEAGNSYITGSFDYSAVFGSISLISSGDKDIFVAKLGADSNWQWATKAGGSDHDEGRSITLDEAGNSYVTGVFRSSAIFGSTYLDDNNYLNLFVAKLGNIIADFSADQTSVPLESEIQFTDLSSNNPTSWEWDFDDDGIIDSYVQNPNYSYSEVGIYAVSLKVFNEYTTDTEIKIDYINVTSTSADNETIPWETMLHANYPNPFNPTTNFSFSIPNNSEVELTIYNINGQKTKTLVQKELTSGTYSIIWNGDNEYSKAVCSGVYLYKLNVNGKTVEVKKCILLK